MAKYTTEELDRRAVGNNPAPPDAALYDMLYVEGMRGIYKRFFAGQVKEEAAKKEQAALRYQRDVWARQYEDMHAMTAYYAGAIKALEGTSCEIRKAAKNGADDSILAGLAIKLVERLDNMPIERLDTSKIQSKGE